MSSSNTTLYPGALPPPPGVTSNLDQHKTDLEKIWTAAFVLMLLFPAIFFSARVYIRRIVMRDWTRADSTLSIAFLLLICEIGLCLSLLNYGVGQHAWNLPLPVYSKFAEILNLNQVVYMPAICFTKMAILLQLLEIFVPSRSGGRWWVVWSFIVFNLVFFTLLFFLELFQCVPRSKIWNPHVSGKCIDIQKTFIATGTINVMEDFGILVMSLYWVSRLQTSFARKWRIAAIFAVGLFACCCSVLRLAESIMNVSNPDITVALVPVCLWANAEISSGIVVACMPYIPKLFQRPGLRTLVEPSFEDLKPKFTLSKKSSSIDTLTQMSISESSYHNEDISGFSPTQLQGTLQRGQIMRTLEVDQYSEPRNSTNQVDSATYLHEHLGYRRAELS